MMTDALPRTSRKKEQYWNSDRLRELDLPPHEALDAMAAAIAAALATEELRGVERACTAFAALVTEAGRVPPPPIAVLGVRPHRTANGVCVYEKYGDYTFATARIRIWMRTAMRQKVTSYGTLLSTLCHELCHHLDRACFGFVDTPHTRGFYHRAALLYHHARGTPLRPLVWVNVPGGVYRIDWGKTMRG